MSLATPDITIDDLRNKALHIRDMTEAEARHIASERATQMVAVGVVAVLVVVSLAYFLGTRRH
jgi:hypothetical protein